MRIQELERQVGIERATIRFYEKEGLITPTRSENGYRDYSDDDAAELKRIKLLRELGVSLETIRSLQVGKEEFAAVMRRQCNILQGRRDQMERARVVCERISADGVSYAQMDTAHYQNLLNAPLLPQPARQGSVGGTFKEREYREPHPWRRFFARFLDYELTYAVLWFFITVVLRWRFSSDLLIWLVGYAIWFVQVPIEAAWIHFLGTTPGKWLFGIRVEAVEGGKLSYSAALERTWRAFYVGMGLNILLLRLYCFYKGYKAHTEDWDAGWDENCEVSFRDFGWKNIVLLILAFCAALGLGVVSELDAELPRYRSNDLTLAQFAENFNYYDQQFFENSCQRMYRDGQMEEIGYTSNMVLPDYGELEHDPYAQFEYELEGDAIKAITFHHTWNEWDPLVYHVGIQDERHHDALAYWMPDYTRNSVMTAILSQGGIRHSEAVAHLEQLLLDLQQPASDGVTATYGAVSCTWKLDLECLMDYPEDSSNADVYEVTMALRIEFE